MISISSQFTKIFGLLLVISIIIVAVYLGSYCVTESFKIKKIKRNKIITDIKQDVQDITKMSNKGQCYRWANEGRCPRMSKYHKRMCANACNLVSNQKSNTVQNDCSILLANQSQLFSSQLKDVVTENKKLLDENIAQCTQKEEDITNNYLNIIDDKQNEIADLALQISNLQNALEDEKILTENLDRKIQEKKITINDLREQLIFNRTTNFQ
jgi:hypothetical protein